MLEDATLKLIMGVAVGVGLYYNYKKQKVKQERLDDPLQIGHGAPPPFVPFGLNKPQSKHEDKQNSTMIPTNEIPIF